MEINSGKQEIKSKEVWQEIEMESALKEGGCVPATIHYHNDKHVWLKPFTPIASKDEVSRKELLEVEILSLQKIKEQNAPIEKLQQFYAEALTELYRRDKLSGIASKEVEYREALENIVKSWDERSNEKEQLKHFEGMDYWSPAASMVESKVIAAARKLLNK